MNLHEVLEAFESPPSWSLVVIFPDGREDVVIWGGSLEQVERAARKIIRWHGDRLRVSLRESWQADR